MNHTINGKSKPWPEAVCKLWDGLTDLPEGHIVTANWFTARPYVDEYNRGSKAEGFGFTVIQGGTHQVYSVEWHVGKPAAAYELPITEARP